VLEALIHDVGLDPVIGDPVHVDFYIVAKGHKIEVDVPIEFMGIAPAEKLGGIVMKLMHEIRIESLPGKLPQHITVDLSLLTTLESHITVGDLKLGDGVRAMIMEHEVVAGITLPKEEEAATAAPIDLSSIEVSQKGKKEETEEEAAS
jgi:large subunit ribosomal protein L25